MDPTHQKPDSYKNINCNTLLPNGAYLVYDPVSDCLIQALEKLHLDPNGPRKMEDEQ